jgi:hypothetical protein
LRFLVLQFQDEAFMSHGVPTFVVTKPLATHYLFDGVTADTSSVTLLDTSTLFVVDKPLDTHYLNDGTTADTSSVTMADTSRVKDVGKALSTHYLNDGVTADTSNVTMSSETGENGARTVPFIVLNKSIDSTTTNYDEDVELQEATATDSGGSLWLSPYTDPYPITSSYFANDSGNYTTGESAFTG